MALLLFVGGARLSAQSVLRIGVIDQADGALLAGARLAADEINAAGGIVGADGSVFQLLVVDTPPQHMDIASANMRQANVIAVVGPVANGDVARGMTRLQALNAPILTPATGDTALLADASGRFFRSRARRSLQAEALVGYLVGSRAARSLHTIQLDSASTAELIILANALAGHGIRPTNLQYDEARLSLDAIAESVRRAAPDAVAIFGPPSLAAQAYNKLRGLGYSGDVIYARAAEPAFALTVPSATLPGIISASSWSYTLDDARSQAFTLAYARAFGKLPDALSAAGYDSVKLLALAAAGQAPMVDELARLGGYAGVQGLLQTGAAANEISDNAVVTRLNKYGAPEVVWRQPGAARQAALATQTQPQVRAIATPWPTATPLPTATPTGYHLIIQSDYQNVRSGPGLEYDIIGQALKGSQLRVLGATPDHGWLVIDYRGQWGWLASYLVETFGNPHLVPVILPPATSTPAPTATTAPPLEADLVVLSADPARVALGQASAVNITVRNQGLSPAGNFAIAGTFQPGNQYVGLNQAGLAAGEQRTLQFSPRLNGPSGPQSVIIVVDLNQEVYEGVAGENNNQVYAYRYIADRAALASGNWTIAPGSFDLDSDGQADFHWSGSQLDAQGSARLALMNGFSSLHEAHYDAMDPARATATSLSADQLRGATVGFISASGRRGYMRVEAVTLNGSLSLSYRAYH